jgi:GH25 family lysozyme M1 (1,4-beta-N-acetylmuramidase)
MSRWQGEVDFAAYRALGYRAVILRVSVGGSYKDDRFHKYYEAARAQGLRIGVYLATNPMFSSLAHYNNFMTHLGGREIDYPPVQDIELTGGQPGEVVRSVNRDLAARLIDRFGDLMVYSGKWFLDQFFVGQQWLKAVHGWAAWYPWTDPPATLPNNLLPSVLPWPWAYPDNPPLLWQWTSKGKHPQVTSANLDFNVGWDEFLAMTNGFSVPDIPQPIPEPPGEDTPSGEDTPTPPKLPEVGTMRLVYSGLKKKVIYHQDKPLFGSTLGEAIVFPDLPPNVKGLDISVTVWGDRIDGLVYFGSGNQDGNDRYKVGARIAVPGSGPPYYPNNGTVLLDGNKLWRQHDSRGGTVWYTLTINDYLVELPELDLSAIVANQNALMDKINEMLSASQVMDQRLKAVEKLDDLRIVRQS